MCKKKQLNKKNVVLLCNGLFPTHLNSTKLLDNNDFIICCDGAANKLDEYGKKPNIIIGDIDSLNNNLNFG